MRKIRKKYIYLINVYSWVSRDVTYLSGGQLEIETQSSE